MRLRNKQPAREELEQLTRVYLNDGGVNFQSSIALPSSTLSLAINAAIRRSASAHVRLGLNASEVVSGLSQPLELCSLLGCHGSSQPGKSAILMRGCHCHDVLPPQA